MSFRCEKCQKLTCPGSKEKEEGLMAQIRNGVVTKYLQVPLSVEEHRLIHLYADRMKKSMVEIGRQLIDRGGLKELLEAAKMPVDDDEGDEKH